jgi:hypothetical protein
MTSKEVLSSQAISITLSISDANNISFKHLLNWFVLKIVHKKVEIITKNKKIG